MNRRVRKIHFVGIGGAGMSGIAEILQQSGYRVTGSDLRVSPTIERLRALGIPISIGHDAAHVGAVDVVVYSSAVPGGNPERVHAEERRIPVIPRAEMLAELMRMKYGVAVAGSHGKTTTTSLIGTVLQAGGLDPTTVVGGRVRNLGSHSRLGAGDILVAEADESDGSFLSLLPSVVVVTNVDAEHLDHYGGIEPLRQAFVEFANAVPFYGAVIACVDDPGVRSVLERVSRRTLTYGLGDEAEVQALDVETRGLTTRFVAAVSGTRLGTMTLNMPGIHNVRNALAAIAVALEFDVPWTQAAEALAEFHGVERRFEIRGETGGVLVIDDYAHHPAEIEATLDGARRALDRPLVVVFQPHRYTRTRDLLNELAGALCHADTLLLTEIYPAGEPKIPGVEGRALAGAVRAAGHPACEFVREPAELVPRLATLARAGDAVLFLGAGDVNRWIDPLLEALERRSAEGGRDD
jgi:UDP-N-acetylmuramate--alanine ligase